MTASSAQTTNEAQPIHAPPSSFLMRYVFARDHKVIAQQFLWLGLSFLLLGGVLAILMRYQLAHPQSGLVSPDAYQTLFTMHGTIMIFFAVTPILIGAVGNFCIPLQIGARDMAFPTLNMLSFWTQLVASGLIVASLLSPGGAAKAGWTSYPPLSTTLGMPSLGQSLFTLALFVTGSATVMGAINYLTTVIRLRAPGMTFFRLPLTVWGLWLTSILNALFVPVLGTAMLLLLIDRTLGTRFFVNAAMLQHGGDPMLYQHLFWIFGHPEVYILILPVWGVISDLLAFFARKPAYGYRVTVMAMIAVTMLSGLVYGHHMFVTAMSPLLGQGFMILTLVISVPAMVLFLNWMHTLWRGAIRLTVPMLFSLGVVFVFGLGGLSGLYLADIPQDVYLHDTYFVVGHFHLIMAAAVFLGSFAAIYFWYPKMYGKALNPLLGKLHFWFSFVPINIVFFGMLIIGNAGMQRRLWDPSQYETFRHLLPLQKAISHTAYLLFAAQLLFIWNFISGLIGKKRAPDNPWQVGTLEWTCAATPPQPHNFDVIPTVLHGPHELSHPALDGKDWLGQAEPLPPVKPVK
jgi:cytochrome c oxidase subunit 1